MATAKLHVPSKRSTPERLQTEPDVESGRSLPLRTAPPDVSPAGTFDTAASSAFDFSHASPPQNVTIEHKVKSGTSRASAGMILGMSKPALFAATLLVSGAGGAAALGWMQIPGLNGQIQELEEQIVKLSGEVDRLASENDRYVSLNGKLSKTVREFQDLNEELNDISGELNTTNLELIEHMDFLADENKNYAQLNRELNTTAEHFETAVEQLVIENGVLSNLTEILKGVSQHQNKTLTDLYGVLNGMTSENDRLESLNDDLVSVVRFLNETSTGLGNSLEEISSFLSNQIAANQVLVSRSLENTYRQRAQNWDCDYRDHFREQSFVEDYDLAISNLSLVIDYAEERVLSELCLSTSDFTSYLLQRYPEGITSFRFISSVQAYAADGLDFYFPEIGEIGVSSKEWEQALYRCDNLPERFSWLIFK